MSRFRSLHEVAVSVLHSPAALGLVDVDVLERFVRWLRPIAPSQGYLLLLMTRSKYLKERFGWKGKDHVVAHKLVPGYLDWRLADGAEAWRARLVAAIAQLSLARLGVVHEREKDAEVLLVPPEGTAVYIQLNPSDVVKASLDVVTEFVSRTADLVKMVESGKAPDPKLLVTQVLHRPDVMMRGALSRRAETRFWSVDVDDPSLVKEVLAVVEEAHDGRPPVIRTARGAHILIDIERLRRLGRLRELAPQPRGEAGKLQYKLQQLRGAHRALLQAGRVEEARRLEPEIRRLEERLAEEMRRGQTMMARIHYMTVTYVDERGVPLVEVKKQALEPCPGTRYKDVIVDFEPETYD